MNADSDLLFRSLSCGLIALGFLAQPTADAWRRGLNHAHEFLKFTFFQLFAGTAGIYLALWMLYGYGTVAIVTAAAAGCMAWLCYNLTLARQLAHFS